MVAFLEYSPAVLMGDFNMDRRHPALRDYLARGNVVDALGETLARDDPGRIDWILCRGVTARRDGGLRRLGSSLVLV